MKTEEFDSHFTQALEQSLPPFSPQIKARALEAMGQGRPLRTRSRARLVAVFVGATAVLVALGFVPWPMGSANSATGALARAATAASQATTVHIIGMHSSDRGDQSYEQWLSQDGFSRKERWQGRKLLSLELGNCGIIRRFDFEIKPNDPIPVADEYFNPAEQDQVGALSSGKSYIASFINSMQLLEVFSDAKTSEHREGTLWGGVIDIVEIEGTVRTGGSIGAGGIYQKGDLVKIRAEIDPHSGRLLSMSNYLYQGLWDKTFEAKYEWEVPIPDDLRKYTPPAGTKLDCFDTWSRRVDKVIAKASSKDWEVTIHDLELDRDGTVYLWLQRKMKRESDSGKYWNGAKVMRSAASDDVGGIYWLYSGYGVFGGEYWTTKLLRETDGGHPRTITLKIVPYSDRHIPDQFAVFKDLPLPPRRDIPDVFAAEEKIIQY
jgi:hypothetical protein